MKVAVIGSGVSGLAAARELTLAGHDVDVFEAAPRIGGHTNTVDVVDHGRHRAIDTGFIVFNERNYPEFTALMREIGVASQPTSMSFSVRCDDTGLEYKGEAKDEGRGISLDGLFAQRRNLVRPRYWRMLRDILRFRSIAPEARELDDTAETVEAFCRARGLGGDFLDLYLVPLGAALWSCPPGTFRQFPMRFVADFLANHSMLEVGQRPVWRVIRGGSREYLAPLTAPFADRIRLSSPVRSVRRLADGGTTVESAVGVERYDQTVFACHADTALSILEAPQPIEKNVLGAFPYQANTAILHTDPSVLPRRRRAWASWNYRLSSRGDGVATVTYNMNILQGLEFQRDEPETVFCVTLNDDDGIDPARVLRRIDYHHPLYTDRRQGAQRRHAELIGRDGVSYCGAYWGYGFHEDGVRSGLAVARRLNEEAAWRASSSKAE